MKYLVEGVRSVDVGEINWIVGIKKEIIDKFANILWWKANSIEKTSQKKIVFSSKNSHNV